MIEQNITQAVDDQEIVLDLGTSGLTLSTITVSVWKKGYNGFGTSVNTNPDRELTDNNSNKSGLYVYKTSGTDCDTLGLSMFMATDGTNTGKTVAYVQKPEDVPDPANNWPLPPM